MEWDWADGPPPWRELKSVREPKAGALSRHMPSSPFCWTTQTRLQVESGLEHDLLRELDRDSEVDWLVSQRFLLAEFADRYWAELTGEGLAAWSTLKMAIRQGGIHAGS